MSKNILVLTESLRSVSNTHLKNAAKELGHNIEFVKPSDLVLNVSEVSGHDKLYFMPDREENTRIYANKFDVVIPRIGKNLYYGAAIVRHLNENLGVPSTASADGLLTASDKLKTTQILSKKRIPVPKTSYVHKPNNVEALLQTVNNLPCIGKLQRGSQGAGVFVLNDRLSALTVLESFHATKNNIILQEFIETVEPSDDGEQRAKEDIRAIVCGDRVGGAMMRYSAANDIRSNYSISKKANKLTLTDEETDMCIKIAKVIGLECCGVDLARSTDGRTVCIEVNGNMSLKGISKTLDRNMGLDIVSHAISLCKGSQIVNLADNVHMNNIREFTTPQIAQRLQNRFLS